MKYIDYLLGFLSLAIIGFLVYQFLTWDSSRIVNKANTAALESTERMNENVTKATETTNAKRAKITAAASDNRAIIRNAVSSGVYRNTTATSDSCQAERKTIATQGIILQECTARLVEMAEYADDHAIDEELLLAAWPTK